MSAQSFKVIALGNIEVGKTSIITRFVDGVFGVTTEFETKDGSVTVEGKTIPLQITDTAGQERFRTLTSSYYRNADAMLVVYDVTQRDTFDDVEGFIREGNRYSSTQCEKILVGNKIDLTEEREVRTQEGQDLANRYSIPFFETSAKTGVAIQQLFDEIGRRLQGRARAGNGKEKKKCVLV